MPRMAFLFAVFALAVLMPGNPALSARIGVASAVKNDVTAGPTRRVLHVGAAVFQNEVVTTGADSSAQLLFRDETSLTLGPNSQIALDRFVYDPRAKSGDIVINIAKGAFRFVSGSADPRSYKIKTPVATIGVRGTVIEGYLGADGSIVLVGVEGTFIVTLPDGTQITVNAGEYITIDASGNVSGPAPWTGPTLDLDAGIRFTFDERGQLLERGGDVLPRWNELNDALDSRDLELNFPPPPPPQPRDNGGQYYEK